LKFRSDSSNVPAEKNFYKVLFGNTSGITQMLFLIRSSDLNQTVAETGEMFH